MDRPPAGDDLAARYGTHRPVRRVVLVVLVVVLAGAGLGWLAWAAWFHSSPAVQAAVESFDVRTSHRVVVTVQVRTRDRYARGECLLQATASDHAVVGELDVQITGSGQRGRHVYEVRTEREATSVEVARCVEAT